MISRAAIGCCKSSFCQKDFSLPTCLRRALQQICEETALCLIFTDVVLLDSSALNRPALWYSDAILPVVGEADIF